MRVRRQFIFKGPSLYATERVIRLTLDPRGQDLLSPSDLSRLAAGRLGALLPADASLWDDDETARNDLSLADCVLRLALVLQREFGYRPHHREVLPAGPEGEVEVVYAYAEPELGLLAGRIAVDLTARAAEAPSTSEAARQLAEAFDRAMAQLRQAATPILTRLTLWEADRRGIPWSRITYSDGFMQLGQGHKRRRFRNSYWQETSYLAARLAISKIASAELLRSGGIPVPRHRLVHSAEAAVAAAAEIGFPVVVKPNGRDMGTAVSINLTDADAVRAAFAVARPHGPALVEKHVAGMDYRITVLHGRMIAAANNIVAHVIGDGQSSIQALIDSINRDPRRGVRDYSPLKKIHPDAVVLETLAQRGYDLESVLPAGERVALRHWWRQGKDHSSEDLTDKIHPVNQAMIERAARLIGLDLAGVDFITTDIARPWFEVGGVINEINPTPGFIAHIRAGAPDVHRITVEAFYPPGDDGRIPLAVVAAAPSAAATIRVVARLLEAAGHCTATATAQGVDIAGQAVSRGPATGVAGADMALGDPLTTAAVLEICDTTAAAQGLGFDRATLAAVMAEPRCAAAAGLLLEVAKDAAILNADLPAVAGLADHCRARRLFWVARDPGADRVAHHIAAGGPAVALDEAAGGATVCLWDAGECHRILPLDDLAALSAAHGLSDTTGMLFAVAMAWGLGLPVQEIAQQLRKN